LGSVAQTIEPALSAIGLQSYEVAVFGLENRESGGMGLGNRPVYRAAEKPLDLSEILWN